MASVCVMTVQGAAELERKLLTLERKIARKVVRQALRKGAKIVQGATKIGAPVKTGRMRKSIMIRKPRGRDRPGTYSLAVLFDTARYPGLIKYSRAGKRYFYPAAVEYGHGDVAGHPFVRPAFESREAEARSLILSDIAAGIERVAAEKA